MVSHTRFPKEDHLPDCASRDNQLRKGDRVDSTYFHSLIQSKLCISNAIQ